MRGREIFVRCAWDICEIFMTLSEKGSGGICVTWDFCAVNKIYRCG